MPLLPRSALAARRASELPSSFCFADSLFKWSGKERHRSPTLTVLQAPAQTHGPHSSVCAARGALLLSLSLAWHVASLAGCQPPLPRRRAVRPWEEPRSARGGRWPHPRKPPEHTHAHTRRSGAQRAGQRCSEDPRREKNGTGEERKFRTPRGSRAVHNKKMENAYGHEHAHKQTHIQAHISDRGEEEKLSGLSAWRMEGGRVMQPPKKRKREQETKTAGGWRVEAGRPRPPTATLFPVSTQQKRAVGLMAGLHIHTNAHTHMHAVRSSLTCACCGAPGRTSRGGHAHGWRTSRSRRSAQRAPPSDRRWR